MSSFVIACSRAYRRMARAFPHQYRVICSDGLEQLGEDVVPLVWQQPGVAGLIQLFADLAWRLPYEYLSTWAGRLKEATMTSDLFEGTWRAIQSEASQWKVPDQPAPQQAWEPAGCRGLRAGRRCGPRAIARVTSDELRVTDVASVSKASF